MSPLTWDGQKVGFDVTIPLTIYPEKQDVIEKLKGFAKKWVFQKETYQNGDHHWQVRLWLIHRKTSAAFYNEVIPKFKGHWSLTSSEVHLGPKSFNYVMKEDTRVEGPWKDSDIMPDRPPFTVQLEEFMNYELWPYQQLIFDRCLPFDMRHIHIFYDPTGHCGKSLFAEFLEYQQVALECPPLHAMEDILQFLHGFPDQRAYIIDMPRGMRKDKLYDFYAGIEVVKNGVLWDKRNMGQKRRQTRPNIFIFTNTLPDFNLMTLDRWLVYFIDPNDHTCSLLKPEPEDEPQEFNLDGFDFTQAQKV